MKKSDIQYSADDYRSFINYLLDRINSKRILRHILLMVNEIYCKL